jgi:hypothetical protein
LALITVHVPLNDDPLLLVPVYVPFAVVEDVMVPLALNVNGDALSVIVIVMLDPETLIVTVYVSTVVMYDVMAFRSSRSISITTDPSSPGLTLSNHSISQSLGIKSSSSHGQPVSKTRALKPTARIAERLASFRHSELPFILPPFAATAAVWLIMNFLSTRE